MPNGAKNWCFTINNWTEDDEQRLGDLWNEVATRPIEYLVYGEETGDNGTPHLQGFVVFKKRRTLRAVKKLIGDRAHLEVARGSPAQAADYCKKDGTFTEYGELPAGRGKRSDLSSLMGRIKEGATEQEIQDEFPGHYLRFKRSILSTIRERREVRAWQPEIIVLWGRSGAGKTRTVYDGHPWADIYTHTGTQWFDGYHGQPVVLFDDFTGSEFKLGYLLKLLDRYPMLVPVKGDFVQWTPKTVYFTSNKDPNDWYGNALQEHQNALFRRINTIRHFD